MNAVDTQPGSGVPDHRANAQRIVTWLQQHVQSAEDAETVLLFCAAEVASIIVQGTASNASSVQNKADLDRRVGARLVSRATEFAQQILAASLKNTDAANDRPI